jgi:hypothetical protein
VVFLALGIVSSSLLMRSLVKWLERKDDDRG